MTVVRKVKRPRKVEKPRKVIRKVARKERKARKVEKERRNPDEYDAPMVIFLIVFRIGS